MNILGISCFFHDAAAALLQNGSLTAAAAEERFSRKKHDSGFPQRAIDFCLRRGTITAGELDAVVFYEKPFVKFERLLLTSLQTFPRSVSLFREAMLRWFGDRLWIQHRIRKHLDLPQDRVFFSEHHLSHAASSFLCSPFNEAALLTVDGVGEWTSAARGVGRGTKIDLQTEIRFPHSLGLLYSTFTAFLGFEVNEGEYKVMGMAGFGRPRYQEEIRRMVRIADDGSFELDLDYFSFPWSTSHMGRRKFHKLFGPPRQPESPFFTSQTGWPSSSGAEPGNSSALMRSNEHYADVAASVQAVTEEILLKMTRTLRKETALPNLSLAGGVALNSVANARILRDSGFDSLYIQPAAGDDGGALGAALYAQHEIFGQPRNFVLDHAYWGAEEDPAAAETFLKSQGVRFEKFTAEAGLLDRTVDLLQQGKVLGWCQGRFEWGPRSLGNRSILADPRGADMKDRVNTRIKYREPFRPFAPSVPAEKAADYFDLPGQGIPHPSDFMLCTAQARPAARETIPAVIHVDGTARVQTVRPETHPRFHHLLGRFGQATGVPVLLNTSFNLRGEPIVGSLVEALDTLSRSGLDGVVWGDFLIPKQGS